MRTVSTEHKRVNIRRNDTVKVMTGRDSGKEGRVLRVLPDEGKVLVEHVMMVKKHVRPNPMKGVNGGIADKTMPIDQSNVLLFNPATGKGERVGFKEVDGKKLRVRDLWKHADVTMKGDSFTTTVPRHGVVLVKVGTPKR